MALIEIVDFPIKDGDFPVRKLLVYQRVLGYPCDVGGTNQLDWTVLFFNGLDQNQQFTILVYIDIPKYITILGIE